MQQVERLTHMTGGRVSAIDFAATGDYLKHYRRVSSQDHQQRANMTASSETNSAMVQDSPASGVDAADGTGKNQSDSAEPDDKSASVEDPDVLAPSDMLCNPNEDQTGLPTTSSHKAETENNESIQASCNGAKFPSFAKEAIISDEDDYNGVDLISESDDEETVVESFGGKAIIDSEVDNIEGAHPSSPPNSPDDALSFDSADLGLVDFDIDPFLTDDIFFKEQINFLDHHEGTNDANYLGPGNSFRSASPLTETPRRRVHFADPLMIPPEASKPLSTDRNNAGTSSAQFGGSPSNKNSEHASNRHESCDGHTETGNDAVRSAVRISDRHTFETLEPMNGDNDQGDNDDDTESSVGSSSGYETDQGETTDEEDVPASATTRPSAVLHDSSTVALANRLVGQPLPREPTANLRPARRRGPTLGSFVTDPTKPIAVIASDGKQLIIYPAQRPSGRVGKVFSTIGSSGQSSVQASPQNVVAKMVLPSHPTVTDDSELERSEMSSQDLATPMLSASPNLMMSGLGLGRGNMLSGHAMGPPEAFFPFQSIGADGTMVLDGLDVDYDDDDDEDEDDGEDLLNIEDFIDFGEDSEDSDPDAESIVESRQSPATSSPTQSGAKLDSVASSPTQSSFLDHLDRGVTIEQITFPYRKCHQRKCIYGFKYATYILWEAKAEWSTWWLARIQPCLDEKADAE
ncbi:MAG: hypothetical protein Q9171_000512 [Xanthocarpia ochracea]